MSDETPTHVREFQEALGSCLMCRAYLLRDLRRAFTRTSIAYPQARLVLAKAASHIDDPHELVDLAFAAVSVLGDLDRDEEKVRDALAQEVHDAITTFEPMLEGEWYPGDPGHEAEAGREHSLNLDGTRFEGVSESAVWKSTAAVREFTARADELRACLWLFAASADRPSAGGDAPHVRGWLYLEGGKVRQREQAAPEDLFLPADLEAPESDA